MRRYLRTSYAKYEEKKLASRKETRRAARRQKTGIKRQKKGSLSAPS